MMNISIHSMQGDEMLETLYTLKSYSLFPSPPLQDKEEWMADVRERKGIICHAAFEGEQAVSVAASTPLSQNMRGKLFAASAVWGVATDPAARRKGYCRQVIRSLLAAERGAGKVFSDLYPFRESFYEKLGYVAFPLTKIARFSTSVLQPLVKLEAGGEIKLQLLGPAYPAYRAFLGEMHQYKHGMGIFEFGHQGRANQNLFWVARADFDGKTEGIMLYRITSGPETRFRLIIPRFYYHTSRARYLLLNWMARHIDQTDLVELSLPEDEYPETWLADMDVKLEAYIRPAMCRVLDIEKMGGMEVGEGALAAHIIDALCPWNDGNWRLESHEGKLQVSKAKSADCELSIQGLSALVAGTRDPQDFALRGFGNPDPALQASLRRLFPAKRPFLHEMF